MTTTDATTWNKEHDAARAEALEISSRTSDAGLRSAIERLRNQPKATEDSVEEARQVGFRIGLSEAAKRRGV